MTKIEALQKTIYNLENDVYEYSWIGFNTCNCGVLARTLLNGEYPHDNGTFNNGSVDENGAVCKGFSGTYAMNIRHCHNTGIPLPKVYSSLHEAGFSVKELIELESAAHDKEGVIRYFKNWLKKLQEEETRIQPVQLPAIEAPAEQPKVIEKTVYVSVPTSITEQSKELILS